MAQPAFEPVHPSKKWLVPLLVLILLLGVTLGAWRLTRQAADERSGLRFESEIRRTRAQLHERLSLYVSALYSTQAFFAASKDVERGEWATYIHQENVRGRYPGLTATCFVARVPDAEAAAFIEGVRGDTSLKPQGYPDFTLHPRAPSPADHYVVKYVQPEADNEGMLGSDLAADISLREILNKSRDTGEPTATNPTSLSGDGGPRDGFLIFLPIYRNGASVSTVEERREALVGFVAVAFHINDFLSAISGEVMRNAHIDFEVYEGAEAVKERLLYDNFNELQLMDADIVPRFSTTIPLRVADKTWTLRFMSLPAFGHNANEEQLPRSTLLFGALLSFLVSGVVLSLAMVRFQAERLAELTAQNLRESQERLRVIIETAHDAFVATDVRGRIIGWNAQAESMFGWTTVEALGAELAPLLLPARYHATFESGLKMFLTTGEAPLLNKRIEFSAKCRDGRELPIEAKVWSVRDGDSHRFNAFVHDISAHRRDEQRVAIQVGVTTALAESESAQVAISNVLGSIGENLDWDAGFFWRLDTDGKLLRCVESWNTPEIDLSGYVTASRQRVFSRGTGLPGRVWASGEPAWIPDVLREAGFHRGLTAAKAGLHAAFAFPIFLGEELLGVMEFFSTEIRPSDEHVLQTMYTAGRQIGQFIKRKEIEEELVRKSAELARSNRELEQFATIASHDLQEPLRKISSYVQLLKERLSGHLDEETGRHFSYVIDAAERMRMLIRDLLVYSHASRAELAFEPTNIAAVMSDTLSRLENAIRETGAFVTYDPLPTVMANGTQINQLLQNLIENAVKYRSQRPPRVHVSARQQNQEWVFSVADNGIGIDLQYAERIFIMFQRLHTREEYPGTGIGLAICKKIVERHGGRIWVESEPDKGSTFFFTLPVR